MTSTCISSWDVSALPAGLDEQRLQKIKDWLDSQISGNRLAGASLLIQRKGHCGLFGAAGIAGQTDSNQRLFDRETIVRLYSMTKPVTHVAAMMLHEQGCFQLDDPVARFLPAFSQMRVWTGEGSLDDDKQIAANTVPARSLITVRQLMTHTAGLSYSFMNATAVDQYYTDHNLVFPGTDETLENLVERLASAPLLCQPGTQWNYSVATDVLGRLVEVWSGQTLAKFFEQSIFKPLSMSSTGFHVANENQHRFADLYGPAVGGDLGSLGKPANDMNLSAYRDTSKVDAPPIALDVVASTSFVNEPVLFSGGGGLTGSIDDYARFCQMLLNKGALNGERLLGRKTVEFMRRNHLPDNADMASLGQGVWSESSYTGIGFGLGFAVVLDPVKAGFVSSAGEHHWGGAASTFFWIDPEEELFVIFLTQLYPSSTYPIRQELRTRVYQALE
ncbi:MAG: beta-lactamase family protein [Granulosicoccus sp.]|nr:beta-lactamase family protein [Granulosicoccus sp.]